MQKNKQQNPSPETVSRRHRPLYKHPLFLATVILIVIAGIVFAVLHFTKKPSNSSDSTVSTSQSSNAPKSTQSSTETKNESTPETPADTTSSDSSVSPDGKTPEKYEGADPNQGETITGSLTTARFDGNKLLVRVNIDQYLSSGTCQLTLTNGANQLEKTARLIPSASTSTCEGFDIDSAELSNFSRSINININLTSGDKTGVITGVIE